MTDIGYEWLLTDIHKMMIQPPNGLMTVDELQGWLNGYRDCLGDVIDLIKTHQSGAIRE